MATNPYSPPDGSHSDADPKGHVLYICMFWLTSILSVVAAAIAIGGGYHNYVAVSQMGGSLPPYIIAVTLLVLACSGLLGYSALNWRKQRMRGGLLTLGVALAAFFVGPRFLLFVLVG